MESEDASSRTQPANDGESAPDKEEVSASRIGGVVSRDGRGMTPGGKKGVTIADTHETSDSTFMPLHQPGAKPSTPGILRMNTPSEANLFAGEAEVGRHLGDDDYMEGMVDIAASTPSRSEVSSRQSSRTVGSKAPSEGGQGRVSSSQHHFCDKLPPDPGRRRFCATYVPPTRRHGCWAGSTRCPCFCLGFTMP